MKSKNLKKIELILLVVALIQIILLINGIFANSYFIGEQNKVFEDVKKIDEKKSSENFGLDFLSWFFSIKQIGIVSAEISDKVCCEKTNDGAWCQERSSNECVGSPFKISPSSCEDTSWCKRGCCFDIDTGTCSPGATKEKCMSDGGKWSEECADMEQCTEGCCYLGKNTQYTTMTRCRVLSEQVSRDVEFDFSKTEVECKHYTDDEGACLLAGRDCKFVAEEECDGLGGTWNKNLLCSAFYPGEVDCAPQDHVGCSPNENEYEIYWFDSCNQKENIYDSNKARSFNDGVVLSKEESCDNNKGNIESSTCGNCMYPQLSTCSESSGFNSVEDGPYTCADLRCEYKGETWENGESRCVYGGDDENELYTGDSRDPVGAEHFKRFCYEGEISIEKCGSGYRDYVCQELQYSDGAWRAECRANLWWACYVIDNRDECEMVPDCRWHNMEVSEHFKFSACVPKYPKGFSLGSGDPLDDILEQETIDSDGSDICAISSQKCTVVWEKQLNDGDLEWVPVANRGCLSRDFAEQMNDFCISLGDCGGYINVEGVYTRDGYDLKGSEMKDESDDNSHSFDVPNVPLERYNEFPFKENTRFDKSNPSQLEQNTPWWIPQSREGSYGDDFNFGGKKMDPNFNDKLAQNIEGVGIAAGTFGGAMSAFWVADFIIYGMVGMTWLSWTGVGALIVAAILGLIWGFYEILGIGDTQKTKISFTCSPWQAPATWEDCEKCNDGDVPCTEYRCKSLGQACGLLNTEVETDNPVCADRFCGGGPGSPVKLSPGEISSDYKFKEKLNGVEISMADGGKVQEGIKINFTLVSDDYAQCKFTTAPLDVSMYEESGEFTLEGGVFSKNHSFEMNLPFIGDEEVNNGIFKLYIRCKQKCGAININEYVVSFGLVQIEDIRAPNILGTEPENPGYMKFGETEALLKVLMDEAGKCSYDFTEGTEYELMPFPFATYDSTEFSSLTIVKNLDKEENIIYIKCADLKGNFHTTDYEFTFLASPSELQIDSILPAQGFERKTPITEEDPLVLSVTTSGGMDNGVCKCEYSFLDSGWGATEFKETNANQHTQIFDQQISEGDYTISIFCKDDAGNEATNSTLIKIKIDNTPPIVVRTYYEKGSLKVVTDEDAKCYYDFESCYFTIGEGTEAPDMETGFTKEHTAPWKPGKTYYIKCKDAFKNENNGCAMVIKPSY